MIQMQLVTLLKCNDYAAEEQGENTHLFDSVCCTQRVAKSTYFHSILSIPSLKPQKKEALGDIGACLAPLQILMFQLFFAFLVVIVLHQFLVP